MGSLNKKYQLFWGDLHNHNAVGYAKGSLERSIEIAREHLDFFAFTGHASWHDMPIMPGERHMHWVKGFEAHSKHWPKTRRLMKEANSDGFVSLLGYEWHSSAFGDYCLIFPEDQPELFLPDHAEKLLAFAKTKNALAIPHHVGYKLGWRGYNWQYFDPLVSPVVEIFSEHGCTMSDRAPYPMILHSNGGRALTQTIEYQLAQGKRFGFVASTDDHFGYPGAYGEGLVGVWAEQLSAAGIFEAIRARRTVAATGDRIGLAVTLNDHPMGSEILYEPDRFFEVEVQGPDSLEMIELLRNGRTIHRFFPEDLVASPLKLPGRAKCRFQYGWGPWSALSMERICQWDVKIAIQGGKFSGVERHFQTGPYDEQLRDRVTQTSQRELHLKSFTSRKQAFLEDATKSVVLEMEADPGARLILEFSQPTEKRFEVPVADLILENAVEFTGVFTTESFVLHRLVSPEQFGCRVNWQDRGREQREGGDMYVVRARQHNNQWAWSSPIWVG